MCYYIKRILEEQMYSYDIRVGFSQSDDSRKMTIPAIIDVFQDCSCFHSDDLDVGFDYLIPKNLAWIINYWEVEIIRRPKYGERLTVGTYPYDFKGFFGYRNFCLQEITPEGTPGDYLVKANSLWLLMDWANMHPAKVTDEMKDAYVLGEKMDMTYSPRKIKIPDIQGEPLESVSVGRHHLDSNGHVNNGQYIKIAMASLTSKDDYHRLRVEYRDQAHLGDVIQPMLYTEGGTKVIVLKGQDGNIYTVVELS